MRIAVLGTGMVGQTLATKLVELGHDVTMGSRQAGNEKAVAWAQGAGDHAAESSFADATRDAEIIVNATAGHASLEALQAAGADNLAGKILIDVANALAPDTGFPPALSVANTDSLGEQIQRAFPDARVVKTLNTINCSVMVNPGVVPGQHVIFLSGNDTGAKGEVRDLLQSFGWPAESIVDLGDITTARGTEMYLPLWLRLMRVEGGPTFNISIQRAG